MEVKGLGNGISKLAVEIEIGAGFLLGNKVHRAFSFLVVTSTAGLRLS